MKPAKEAVPPIVVTDTAPVAPAPTVAVILVAEFTVKIDAGMPPKLTDEAPVKFVPVITTTSPVRAIFGVNAVIFGAGAPGRNVKPARWVVPPGVVTATAPVAPEPTVAVICVSESTTKLTAVPPKLTALAPVKPVPVSTTLAPTPALVGVNEEIVGGTGGVAEYAKPNNDAVPAGFVTITAPYAPVPTIAVIFVSDTTVNDAAEAPPKLTVVVPVKPVPYSVTTALAKP